ncbi:MAG: histidine phosphatase family protein [Bacteroidia bacterium]|nr:histidine phosphatase family protein [Bacteroidia bacterium]
MLELYFLRHGQTEFNLKGIVQGRGVDSDLNEEGRAQGEAFYRAYRNEGFNGLVVSNLKRTYQTIEPFIREEKRPLLKLEGLDELSWGVMEGMSSSPEMHAKYLELNREWGAGNLHARVEAGESPLDCWNRAQQSLEIIQKEFPSGKVLVCTHGRMLRIILSEILGYGMANMNLFPHENTALNVVRFLESGKAFAVKLNDLTHLN